MGFKVVALREEVCYLTVLVINQLASVLSFLRLCLKVVNRCLEFSVFVEEVRDLLVFVIHSLMCLLDLFLLRGNILLGLLLYEIYIRTKEGRLQVKRLIELVSQRRVGLLKAHKVILDVGDARL